MKWDLRTQHGKRVMRVELSGHRTEHLLDLRKDACVIAEHENVLLPIIEGGARTVRTNLEEPFGKFSSGVIGQRIAASKAGVKLEHAGLAGGSDGGLEAKGTQGLAF